MSIKGKNQSEIKDAIRKHLTPKLTQVFTTYAKELCSLHGASIQIPIEKENKPMAAKVNTADKVNAAYIEAKNATTQGTPAASAIATTTLTQNVEFVAPLADVYAAMTDPARVAAWTGGSARFQPTAGADFEMFGGSVRGTLTALTPNQSIEMTWRQEAWPAGHFSHVTLTFTQEDNGTKIALKQTHVPRSDADKCLANWQSCYWHRIKACFGWGGFF